LADLQKPGIILGQRALQPRVVPLNGDHRVVEQLADGRLLGMDLEIGPAGFLGHPKHVHGQILVPILQDRVPLFRVLDVPVAVRIGGPFPELRLLLLERIRDVRQEDQPQDDVLVLGRVHVVAHLVGGQPPLGLEPQVRAGLVLFLCLSHQSRQSPRNERRIRKAEPRSSD
jgi:hypothetical protein